MIEQVGSYLLRLSKSRVKDYAGNILLAFEWIKEIVERAKEKMRGRTWKIQECLEFYRSISRKF